MNDRSYETTLVVEQTAREAFDAINDVRRWWSEDLDGRTDAVGEEFTFRAKDIHRSRIRITELIPGERVVWRVLDNYMNFVQDQTEWKDTEIRFDIAETGDGTEIRFTHAGLVPDHECYDICSNAWGFYINGSLRGLITTGTGEPILREAGHANQPV
ncbi:SRPBCC domain-containing protein [Leifsonia sp. NPDC058248]|uniref:SRPBCC family protein n=1 Tax=Leifsonia sp. NPDC058248 TaxID=3346402 RepID=UPI0036DBA80C